MDFFLQNIQSEIHSTITIFNQLHVLYLFKNNTNYSSKHPLWFSKHLLTHYQADTQTLCCNNKEKNDQPTFF